VFSGEIEHFDIFEFQNAPVIENPNVVYSGVINYQLELGLPYRVVSNEMNDFEQI